MLTHASALHHYAFYTFLLLRSRQAVVLGRKRQEYYEMVPQYYDISNAERSEEELTALRQVRSHYCV